MKRGATVGDDKKDVLDPYAGAGGGLPLFEKEKKEDVKTPAKKGDSKNKKNEVEK